MTRIAASKAALLAAAVLLSGTAFVNCSKSKTADSDVGSVGLAVTLSPGVIVNTVAYKISGNGITPITGSVDVTGNSATVSLLVSGIPAGTGYLLELNATATDGQTICAGQANFNVTANQTTGVNVILQCRGPGAGTGRVIVNGRFNNCPVVTSMSASPLQTGVGGVISLSASASDLDAIDTITYAWTSSAAIGTFGSAGAASTTFTCTAAGTSTLAIAVSDSVCGESQSIEITCAAVTTGSGGSASGSGGASGTGGVVGTGGTPGTGGVVGTGGTPGTGGAGTGGTGGDVTGTGGVVGTGGTPGTGGVVGTGGTPGTGGSGTGGSGGMAMTCDSGPAACVACTTAECNPATDGCCGITDAADRALCESLYSCILANTATCTSSGSPVNCWCGTNLTTCTTTAGAANGPCVSQFIAAAKSADPAIINLRFVDPTFPIGRAVNLSACRGSFCSECGIQ